MRTYHRQQQDARTILATALIAGCVAHVPIFAPEAASLPPMGRDHGAQAEQTSQDGGPLVYRQDDGSVTAVASVLPAVMWVDLEATGAEHLAILRTVLAHPPTPTTPDADSARPVHSGYVVCSAAPTRQVDPTARPLHHPLDTPHVACCAGRPVAGWPGDAPRPEARGAVHTTGPAMAGQGGAGRAVVSVYRQQVVAAPYGGALGVHNRTAHPADCSGATALAATGRMAGAGWAAGQGSTATDGRGAGLWRVVRAMVAQAAGHGLRTGLCIQGMGRTPTQEGYPDTLVCSRAGKAQATGLGYGLVLRTSSGHGLCGAGYVYVDTLGMGSTPTQYPLPELRRNRKQDARRTPSAPNQTILGSGLAEGILG